MCFLVIRVRAVLYELANLKPAIPNLSDFTKVSDMTTEFSCNAGSGLKVGFDGLTGAIIQLFDVSSQQDFANAHSPLAQLRYTTWNESGYDPVGHVCDNVLGGKPGSNEAKPETRDWNTTMEELYVSGKSNCSFYVRLSMPTETQVNYGGFATVRLWLSK